LPWCGEEALDDVQRFVAAPEGLLGHDPEGRTLRLRGSRADCQIETALGQDVQHRDLFGNLQRMIQRQQQHEAAEAHPRGEPRKRRQAEHAARIPAVLGQMMFGQPDAVEAGFFREQRELDELVVDLRKGFGIVETGANCAGEADFHESPPSRRGWDCIRHRTIALIFSRSGPTIP